VLGAVPPGPGDEVEFRQSILRWADTSMRRRSRSQQEEAEPDEGLPGHAARLSRLALCDTVVSFAVDGRYSARITRDN
jgi:hypothetical protein